MFQTKRQFRQMVLIGHRPLFWDVYYIKGAFLDSEKAFDVLNGMKTLEQRMMTKVINTQVFTAFLNAHDQIRVNCHALPEHSNAGLREKQHTHGWPVYFIHG